MNHYLCENCGSAIEAASEEEALEQQEACSEYF